MTTEEKCENCKYFRPRPDKGGVGLCHRYPPTVVEGVWTDDDEIGSTTFSLYPNVDVHALCGEFKEKK